ncbi:sulfur carrier protein ThiS [Acidisoma cellulosilytica]|uniref:Sulfur carrier protein ThiS n=1 Tax=Acidisoma cellulosilyticum TaxID=2802395 RepID=A0A963YYH8_9PROT|nr:sulfur carrier protein ThiS [Acidisoma cellulosilyticum]MCB8879598.1 sulfur carrier protein ThiS [Acidisoma cellulosilyticum]
MKIRVNDEEKTVTGASLADALAELGYDGAVIATAVNGDFTPRQRRAQLMLNEGDRLELLAPMRGG